MTIEEFISVKDMYWMLSNLGKAFERMSISMQKAEIALTILARVFDIIEQTETRRRILEWEGVWLWD